MADYQSSNLLELSFGYAGYVSSDLLELSFLKDVQASDSLILTFSEKYKSSDVLNLEFSYVSSLDTLEIFGVQIDRRKLYGIYLNSRKPKQTQNITQGFVVSTLIENIDLEYSCDFQWLNKSEKEGIINYIKENNGKKILIKKSLLYEFEGGETTNIAGTDFVSIIANYEDVQVTRKNNHFFDLKLKLKTMEIYNLQ